MRNAFTLYAREMWAYFTSPVGYVFLAAFLMFSNLLGLFVLPPGFFDFPLADMRKYFHVVAGVSAFLVAAVTMRMWAEERRGNTYEMLLTLPMKSWQLVLGKFFAAWNFYIVALALTLTVPVMMMVAARPEAGGEPVPWYGLLDIGAAATGYLGAVLLGALFIAFGLFISGLCSDQIVAFVLTAPVLFLAYFLGLPWVAQAMDQALSFIGAGAGAALGSYIGVFSHYDNFVRGLVDLGDVLFFIVWTLLFLFLNALSLERRGKANATPLYAAAVVLALAVGGAANWMFAEVAFPWKDMTTDGQFTVAEVSGKVLSALPEKIRVRYHVTPKDKMPINLRELEREVRDKLDALNHASGGKIAYQIVYRDVAEADDEATEEAAADTLEKRLFASIRPFTIEAIEDGKASAQLIYSALEITYPARDREPEILPSVLPMSQPQNGVTGVGDIEYRVVAFARSVTRAKKPVVALYAPIEEPSPQEMMLYMQMGQRPPPPFDPWQYLHLGLSELEGFTVRRTALTQADPMPEEYDLLVVVAAATLEPRQQYEINLALAKGKPVVLAAQRFTVDFEMDYETIRRRKTDIDPGIAALLPDGLGLGDAMLMADPGAPLAVPIQTPLGQLMTQLPAWPMHPELSGDAFVGPADLARNVPLLRVPWAAPLAIDGDKLALSGLDVRLALRSNAGSWTRALTRPRIRDNDMKKPDDAPDTRYPLAALVTGSFPMRFGERPAWPPMEPSPMQPNPPPPDSPGPVDDFAAAPGTLFIMGDAWAFHQQTIRYPELTYFLNLCAHLALDAEDLAIRALQNKAVNYRHLGPLSAGEARFWKAVQVGGHALLLTAAGLAVWLCRRRRRERYASEIRA